MAADIVDFLGANGPAHIAAMHAHANARQRERGLPEIPIASVRRALNSNTGQKGHGLFRRERRGLYSLSRRPPNDS